MAVTGNSPNYTLPKIESREVSEELRQYLDNLVGEIESALEGLAAQAGVGYEVTNNSAPARTLDVAAATLGQLRIVVGTLIEDLQGKQPAILGS